jgi:hypothetical protein
MLDGEYRSRAEKIFNSLCRDFPWASTEKGFDYWNEVAKQLAAEAGLCERPEVSTTQPLAADHTFWLGKEGDSERE